MSLSVHTLFSDITALFFPKNCAVCGKPLLRQEKILCTSCYYRLPFTGFFDEKENPVTEIFMARLPLVFASSLLFFNKGGMAQQLIHQLKYDGKKEIGSFLGKLIGIALQGSPFISDVDIILPVPLHPKKEHQRGYNQSYLIGRAMAEQIEIPVSGEVLFRKVYTATQTKKSRYERWQNVKDIFAVKNENLIRNKHVLLVDDVITTGATLEACGNELIKIPGVRLSIVSAAYAQ
jgi:ComF family protein